ncbi:hypothetical protein ABZ934_31905 [Streptomyces sp. NPDC046557]|uniref:hypothetical protein n=1 Tax=Streptomyces sp. NPDC046557 TaxID=3155372 RepID=UPI0033EC9B28
MPFRSGIRHIEMVRCDERSPIPCPKKGTGRCGGWHPTTRLTERSFDDFIRGAASGLYVRAIVKEKRTPYEFWTPATDSAAFLDATSGEAPVTVAGPTVASLVPAGPEGATHRFGLDDPWLPLADDAAGEDLLSGWSTDDDADALAELAAGESGASLRRLTAPGTGPLAVMGEVRVAERFRSGSGGLRLTLTWPADLRHHCGHRGGRRPVSQPYGRHGAGCGACP